MTKEGYRQHFQDQMGITPEEFLNEIGLVKPGDLMKAETIPGASLSRTASAPSPNPGVAARRELGANPPIRGFTENPFDAYAAKGIKERVPRYQHAVLREIERKTPIVSAIVNLRCRQLRQFSTPTHDKDVPGFRIELLDEEAKPSKEDKAMAQRIAEWFVNTGYTDFPGSDRREDMLHDVMSRLGRETLTIDQIAIELRRNKKGKALDFWTLDGATIKRIYDGGYRGQPDDFDPRAYIMGGDTLYRRLLNEAKQELIPPMHEIAYVQELSGRLVAAYTRQDIVFDHMNKRTDVRFYGYGYSLLEQAMAAITAFLFALQYNAEQFNSGTIPKIALAFKNGNYSPEQLQGLQDEWIANFRGVQGQWRIPMFNGDVEPIDLLKSPKDMEHSQYMQFTGALISAIMGVDTAELGLRFQAAQNVLSENMDARQKFSKDRGLLDQLGFQQVVFNKIMRLAGWANRFRFRFTGIAPTDKDAASKLRSEAVKTYMTIDEIRAREDLQPLPDGAGKVILDATFMNQQMQREQTAQAGAEGGAPVEGGGEGDAGAQKEGDAGTDELTDEDLDELVSGLLAKAKRPSASARLIKAI